jgi:hypothetical protein
MQHVVILSFFAPASGSRRQNWSAVLPAAIRGSGSARVVYDCSFSSLTFHQLAFTRVIVTQSPESSLALLASLAENNGGGFWAGVKRRE